MFGWRGAILAIAVSVSISVVCERHNHRGNWHCYSASIIGHGQTGTETKETRPKEKRLVITDPVVALGPAKTAAEKMATLRKDFQKAHADGHGGVAEARLRCPRGRDQTRARHHRDPERTDRTKHWEEVHAAEVDSRSPTPEESGIPSKSLPNPSSKPGCSRGRSPDNFWPTRPRRL